MAAKIKENICLRVHCINGPQGSFLVTKSENDVAFLSLLKSSQLTATVTDLKYTTSDGYLRNFHSLDVLTKFQESTCYILNLAQKQEHLLQPDLISMSAHKQVFPSNSSQRGEFYH